MVTSDQICDTVIKCSPKLPTILERHQSASPEPLSAEANSKPKRKSSRKTSGNSDTSTHSGGYHKKSPSRKSSNEEPEIKELKTINPELFQTMWEKTLAAFVASQKIYRDPYVTELQEKVAALTLRCNSLESDIRQHEAEAKRWEGFESKAKATCIIDGDGFMFKQELVTRQKGGLLAAQKIHTQLHNFMASQSMINPGTDVELEFFSYCNSEAFVRNVKITEFRKNWLNFVSDLHLSTHNMRVVGVGWAKEGADRHVKRKFNEALKSPLVRIVFLGGLHDTGYLGELQQAETEGYKSKVVLLNVGEGSIHEKIKVLGFVELKVIDIWYDKTTKDSHFGFQPIVVNIPESVNQLIPKPCGHTYVSEWGYCQKVNSSKGCSFDHDSYVMSSHVKWALGRHLRSCFSATDDYCWLREEGKSCKSHDKWDAARQRNPDT